MFYNCHIHTFKGDQDVPVHFLPLGLVRWLAKRDHPLFNWILHNLNPFTPNDELDRALEFIRIGKLGSQLWIFQECLKNYPSDTKFIILPMDMAYMGAGEVPRDYEEQLIELKKLRDTYPENIIPFIHVDPRRPNYKELFLQAVNQWKFKGVKLYPSLGVFPFDARFEFVYQYCSDNNLPVIAHCTAGNPVYYKGKKKDLLKLLERSIISVDPKKSNKELCANFTHPINYQSVLANHPNMNICLAHYGRENEWDNVIRNMIKFHDNLWVDISYSMYNEKFWPGLKVGLYTNKKLRERVLFGSDFYMVEMDSTEKQFDINFRAYIGEELWNQISVINPIHFLKLN